MALVVGQRGNGEQEYLIVGQSERFAPAAAIARGDPGGIDAVVDDAQHGVGQSAVAAHPPHRFRHADHAIAEPAIGPRRTQRKIDPPGGDSRGNTQPQRG